MSIADLPARLPSPLALPLQRYLEESDPRLKLWAMCDSVELLLRLLVFVGIADLAGPDGRPPPELRARLREPIERPTLGRWADMAEAVAQTRAGADSLAPELTPLVQHTLLPLLDGCGERRTERTSLIELRNVLAHGGGVARALAEKLLAVWQQPFERAMQTAAWLGELALVVRGPDGYGCLRGPTPDACPYTPGNLAAVAEALALADAVAVVRHDRALPLWPLVLYGPPRNPYDDYPSAESVPQLYVRQGEIHLQYTPLGGTVCHSQAGDAALARFQELFHVDREPSRLARSRFAVRDFRDRIRSLADRLVGRTVELATLRGVLDATPEGVIWVAGTAGIGKSSLLARIARDHLDAPPANTLLLPYWFDAGDERCQRETFLRFASERLRDWLRMAPPDDGAEPPKPLQHLRDLLQQLDGRRVLFVLDGLDEITGRDAHFARDVPLALRLPGVTWLCAGRPEHDLPQWFRPEIAQHPFPDGLPPMREGDIREMLLDNLTGALRQRLVGQDRERGEQVINPFIANVAKAAHGLPLYVRYVINDIWAGRYRMLDAGERLPPSLNDYHEDHLRRCAVSSLHQILTPMVALLAVVHEEPTADILAALLRQRTLIPAGEEGVALVRSGLSALESMLCRKRAEDGRVCYALHHHSLRQHIQESPRTRQAVATAREFLGDAALQVMPDAAAPYLYRYGIDHLVEDGAGRHQDALRLLTRFNYLMARFHALQDTPVAADLRIDWQAYRRTGGGLDDAARIWEAFFREQEHILCRGDDAWPAYKILLQLAIEHADDSPITQQAEAWLAQPGNCDWMWLRNPCRPEHVPFNPVVRVFEGHADAVNGGLMLDDGRLLSWSDDCTLRLWDSETGETLKIMEGHAGPVKGVIVLDNGNIVSWSDDRTLRLWNGKSGLSLAIMEGHSSAVRDVKIFPNGNILSCSNEVRIWNGLTGALVAVIMDSAAEILPTGNIVSWSGNVLRLWDPNGDFIAILEGHSSPVKGVMVFNNNLLSWGEEKWNDKELVIWNSNTGKLLTVLKNDEGKISEFKLLTDQNILLINKNDNQNNIMICRILTGTVDILLKSEGSILAVDGKNFLLRDDNQNIIQLWDGEFCQAIYSLENTNFDPRLYSWHILGNAYILAWEGYDKEITLVWDYKNGKLLFSRNEDDFPEEFSGLEREIKFISGHKLLIKYYEDTTYLEIAKIDRNKNFYFSEFYKGIFSDFCLFPENKILLWTEFGLLKILDTNICLYDNEKSDNQSFLLKSLNDYNISRKFWKRHRSSIVEVKILPKKKILCWDKDSTGLWDYASGKCIGIISPFYTIGNASTLIDDVQILEDGRIFIQCLEGGIKFWDIDKKNVIFADDWSAQLLPNETLILLGEGDEYFDDFRIEIWDTKTYKLISTLRGHSNDVKGIIPLLNQRILSWSKDCTLRIWDIYSGQCISILKGHTRPIADVKILTKENDTFVSWCDNSRNPYNNDNVLGSDNDYTVRIWDSNLTEYIALLQGHSGEVSGISVLDFINSFCTWSSEDKTCIWWDSDGVQIGKPIPLSENLKAELRAWINYSEPSSRSHYYGHYSRKEFLSLSYDFLTRLKEYAALYDEHQYVCAMTNEMENIAQQYFREAYAFDYIKNQVRATNYNNIVEVISLPEKVPVFRWLSSDIIEIKALTDDLTLIVSSSSGQIICLKLYEGETNLCEKYHCLPNE